MAYAVDASRAWCMRPVIDRCRLPRYICFEKQPIYIKSDTGVRWYRMDMMDNVFMLAGPVKIHPRVLREMSHPSIAHRSPEFTEVLGETRELLKYLFQADREVALLSGSGTAALEASITGIVDRDEKILCLENGKFGERLGEIASVFTNHKVVKADWGVHFDLDEVAAELETGEYRAIALCHNETSTAMTNDAAAIGRLAAKHDVRYLLDGITSVGGLEVKPEELGADLVVFGSQKCIAAPSGLAAVSISDRLLDELNTSTSYYLNLKKHAIKLRDGSQTPYTPAIHLIMGFREALRMVKEEGLENRVAKFAAMGDATRAGAKALGFTLFPDEAYASNTCTAINYPEGLADSDFRPPLWKKHNVIIAGAQAHIKGKVFRIGHMGLTRWTELVATFGAMESVLIDNGFDIEPGVATGEIIRRMG